MNVVKDARKNYKKHQELGAKITENRGKGGMNYAAPTHPVLREMMKMDDEGIIDRFDKILNDFDIFNKNLKFTNKGSIAEALVTSIDLGMGGFVDKVYVVDKKKKICRVQDYKFNIDSDVKDRKQALISATNQFKLKGSDEFIKLPATKLSKYQIQFNYYAFILWKAGWTIEGLDAFVFEEEWKHYELELFDFEWFETIIKKINDIK